MNAITKYQAKDSRAPARSQPKKLAWSLDIRAFLAWWGEGLCMCLPMQVRQFFWREVVKLVLVPQEGGVRVYRERGKAQDELGVYEDIDRWKGNLLDEGEVVILRLPPKQVLSKRIVLPLAAEENLQQVLAFEMERHTPFVANQVYYDFTVLERNLGTRQLVVKLVVVPRAILGEWLERLANWGLQPAAVSVAGAESEGINLLPAEKRPARSGTLPRLNLGLALLLVLLAAVALLLPLWQERNVVVATMPVVAAAQKKAEAVTLIRQQVEKAIESSEFLIKEKEKIPATIEFLYELTRLLSDGTWLQQVGLTRNGEVDIRGEASEASALIARLEASPYFQNVQFRSPVTTNAATGRDRFHITAQIPKQ
jgi:general secretion pathway protein L